MTLSLKHGKFYDAIGNVVPLAHGNVEQIELLNTAAALNGDGVCTTMVNSENQVESLFRCLCGKIHSVQINKKFKC
jgi:hypothetical protein